MHYLIYVAVDGEPNVFPGSLSLEPLLEKLIDYVEVGFLRNPKVFLSKEAREVINRDRCFLYPDGSGWRIVVGSKLI